MAAVDPGHNSCVIVKLGLGVRKLVDIREASFYTQISNFYLCSYLSSRILSDVLLSVFQDFITFKVVLLESSVILGYS